MEELFKPYIVVQIYTDTVLDRFYSPELRGNTSRAGADAAVNRTFQKEAFGSAQLPLYVVLEPRDDGRIDVVDVYPEGLINNESAFAEFLKNPGGRGAQARASR